MSLTSTSRWFCRPLSPHVNIVSVLFLFMPGHQGPQDGRHLHLGSGRFIQCRHRSTAFHASSDHNIARGPLENSRAAVHRRESVSCHQPRRLDDGLPQAHDQHAEGFQRGRSTTLFSPQCYCLRLSIDLALTLKPNL